MFVSSCSLLFPVRPNEERINKCLGRLFGLFMDDGCEHTKLTLNNNKGRGGGLFFSDIEFLNESAGFWGWGILVLIVVIGFFAFCFGFSLFFGFRLSFCSHIYSLLFPPPSSCFPLRAFFLRGVRWMYVVCIDVARLLTCFSLGKKKRKKVIRFDSHNFQL